MGNLVWHEYSRLISITASAYAVWSAFFALFYRKFFWDFVGGTLRDPGGLQPSPSASIFISLIVKAPIIPIINAVVALFILAVEFPLAPLRSLSITRSMIFKVVLLVFQAFFSVLYYQGTNAALWSIIAILCYIRAMALGETIEEAKANRGQGGRA
ncbi:Pro41-like protein [Mycena sanguinolenta]|uniref:Pro41-like protein n=1 Tax=Mycena sanguinolenta TaxID=230812 RepID=A0A8H6ZGE4_9AGAR|nr:Pro41-like protein [Mycena sanguinolenta]